MKLFSIRKKGYGVPLNLQFFAESESESGEQEGVQEDEEEGDDDQDEPEEDEAEESEEKKFTQKDLDDIVKKRIRQERRKLLKNNRDDDNKAGKEGEKNETAEKIRAAEDRAKKAEAKAFCLEKDVNKEYVDDVIVLAQAYMTDDTDLENAVEEVLDKYPQFKKTSEQSEEGNKKPHVITKSTVSGKKGKKMTLTEAMKYKNSHPEADIATLI